MTTANDTLTPATAPAEVTGLSTVDGALLVAKREITTEMRSKAFIWGLIVTLAIVALLIVGQKVIGSLFADAAGFSTAESVATTMDAAALEQLGLEVTPVESAEAAIDLVRSGDAGAAVITGAEAKNFDIYAENGELVPIQGTEPFVLVAKDSTPGPIMDALTVLPTGGQIEPPATELSPMVTYFIGLFLGMIYMTSIVGYAARIAQIVVEEKSSRIVELLLVTVRPRTILAGKVLGGTVLSLLQVVAIVAVALISLAITGQIFEFGGLVPGIIWFSILFVLGFMLFAALYAGVGSTVSRPEDVGSATSWLTFVAMIPYMLVIIFNTNQEVLTWLSYIPISSPVAMPMRVIAGTAAWWEPIVALVLLVLATLVCIWFGAKIYENTILRTSRVKLLDALKSA